MPKTKASTKAKPATKTTTKAASASDTPVTTRVTRSRTSKAMFSQSFGGDIRLNALLTELIGTFILVGLLLGTNGNAIVAGITILFVTTAFMRLSGGHANPATTVALMALRKVSMAKGLAFIVAQLLGAMLALVVISQFVHSSPGVANPYTGEMTQAQVFKLEALNGDWRPFFAEMVGAVVLGLGVAAAWLSRRENLEAGFLVGGSLLVGMLLATQGSTAVLNPAAALGLDAYKMENFWTIAVFAIAPLLGAALGAVLYRSLLSGASAEHKEAE